VSDEAIERESARKAVEPKDYEWIAIKELKLAAEATLQDKYGIAESHRKNAQMAFDFAMRLQLSK